VTRLFRIEMVGTTENVEVHVVILWIRVDRKVRLGEDEYTSDTERLKLMERPTDDSQLTLVCNLFHQRLNLINILEVNTRDTSDEVLHSYFKNVRFFYTMSSFTIIDGELTVLREGQIEYVFERDSLSRAAYNYMIQWIQDKKTPADDPGTVWLEAEKAWDALSPEMQGMIIAIANKERQQARDIRDGLLATLHGYQGVNTIKDAYAECIRACFSQF
jgi:hypothetical protein